MIALDIALTLNAGTVMFFILAAAAVISAILVVEHKSLTYSAVFLAILGMTNATLFVCLVLPSSPYFLSQFTLARL